MAISELWIPSPHYSTGSHSYNKAVLHTTEGAMKIRDLGAWFQNPSAQCSSHHGADNYERLLGAYVYEQNVAWTQGNANGYCLSLEQCAYASWSRDTWLNSKGLLLQNTADWLAYVCGKYGIPLRALSNSEAQNSGTKGVCQHVQLGSWGSNHSDCGSGFPMDKAIEMAKGGGGTTPAPIPVPPPIVEEEDDMVIIPPGTNTPDIGFSFPKIYTAIGFCADVGRLGADAVVKIRVALHSKDNPTYWDVKDVAITPSKPKFVLAFPADYDGCSFRRQDDFNIDVIPNFK